MINILLKNSGMRLLAVLTCAMAMVTAHAYDYVDENGLAYDLNSDWTATVTYKDASYGSYSGNVTVPKRITADGRLYLVTAVGDNAFRACDQLTSVTIEKYVTSIGKRAFLGCSALNEVRFGMSMTSVGDYAFADCTSLQHVVFNNDEAVSLGTGAFLRCSALNNVEWASCSNLGGKGGMTVLGTNAFAGCSSLEQIFLPGNIEELGNSIFDGCSSLKTITLMVENPIAVKGDPFSLNTSQVTLKVPRGVTAGSVAASYRAAIGWRDYNIVELPYSFIAPNGLTYNKLSGSSVALTGSQVTVSYIVVPMSITGYKGETYDITEISDYAFKGDAVKTLDVSQAKCLKRIGVEAFAQGPLFRQATLVEGLATIGQEVFKGCVALTSVKIPSTVREIPFGAFDGCTKLGQVELMHGVSLIDSLAFANCIALKEIVLPRSVAVVKPRAFAGATSLESISVDGGSNYYTSADGVLIERLLDYESPAELQGSILKIAVYPCGKKDVNYFCPSGIVELSPYSFEGATKLKYIAVPATVSTFSDHCFANSRLETINYRAVIPSDTTVFDFNGIDKSKITLQVPLNAAENYRQDEWSGFKEVVERYDIWHNDQYAFDWNVRNHLTVVDIMSPAVTSGGTLTLITDYSLSGVDYLVTGLKNTSTAHVAGLVHNLKINSTEFDVIDTTDGINPLSTLSALSSLSINSANNSFMLLHGMLSSRDQTKVYYFIRNRGETTITLYDDVDTIMPQAFANCINLQRVVCKNKLKEIGVGAFENCTQLNVVDGATKVVTIKARAFKNSALKSFNDGLNIKEIGEEAFAGCNNLAGFSLAHGSIMYIGDRAFKGCSKLKVMIMNSILKHIGNNVFEGCVGLESVYFTSDVKEFGQALFKGCTALKNLWICNDEVPVIDYDTFEGNNVAAHNLWVPTNSYSQYKSHPVWGRFGNINRSVYLDNGADVNNDKSVNALDVTLIYNVILGNTIIDVVGRYDVNHDGSVNAADISLVYNFILNGYQVEREYSFVTPSGSIVSNDVSLTGTHTLLFAHSHSTNQNVTSGLSGMSDNTGILDLQLKTSGGAQCVEIVPLAKGLVAIVMIVEGNGVSYFREFPLKVVD